MCEIAQELFPNADCFVVYAIFSSLLLILGGAVFFWLRKRTEDDSQLSTTGYAITENEEEKDGGYDVVATLNMKDGTVIKIFCDTVDEYSFSGGSATFYWYHSGLIAIEDGEGNEMYNFDSDEDSVVWGVDGVKSWEILGV